MISILGLNFYGDVKSHYKSPTSPVRNMSTLNISNSIYDELHVKEKANNALNSTKKDWEVVTRLLAKFKGNLEGGNLVNNGLQVARFAIKRRRIDELNDLTIAYSDFENDKQFEYVDYSQPNDEFIYSIVPISENGLEGLPNSTIIKSNFAGWFLVDKDTNDVVAFDKSIGSVDDVQTTLEQGRTEIQTMSRFPNVFYDKQRYHRMSLSTVIIPSEWERSGRDYNNFLNKFIYTHKPFILKGSSGEVYVCDISNPVKSAPKNTWEGHDYFNLTIDAVEIEDYEEFINEING